MRGARVRVAAAGCLVAALVAGCSGSDDVPPRPEARPSADASAGAGSQAPATPTPSSAPPSAVGSARPSAAEVPASPGARASPPALVERPGALPPSQRVPGPQVAFDQPAAYRDGLSVVMRDIRSGTSSDTGVGAQADVPTTTLVVEVRNGTPSPVDLSGVVLTVTYGPDDAVADPVYGGDQQDLAGVVPSGGRAQGTYSFAVPEQARGDVTLSMDVDGRHLPAVWRGAVT